MAWNSQEERPNTDIKALVWLRAASQLQAPEGPTTRSTKDQPRVNTPAVGLGILEEKLPSLNLNVEAEEEYV